MTAPAISSVSGQTCASIKAKVIHDSVQGRVRLRHAALCSRDDIVHAVEAALHAHPGVLSVQASSLTGSVLVKYGPPMTIPRLVRELDAAVSGPGLQSAEGRPPIRSRLADGTNTEKEAAHEAWHAVPIDEIVSRLRVLRSNGLSQDEAEDRLARYGRNQLPQAEPRSAIAIFAEQLISLPIALLGVSAALSLATGGLADAAIIGAVVLLNGGIATATERQAERTILGLSNYVPLPVTVLRDGSRRSIDPGELVPGDIISIGRGTLVPADARLIACDDLTVNEATLTGEALPVHKDAQLLLAPETGLTGRCNMLFRGTAVTGGSGSALITATGTATEIGRIHRLLGSVRAPQTPIQRQLGDVERELIIVNGLICGAVFGLGILGGQPLLPMLRSAISLAIAAIPEGLPAVATTTLALGIQDMRRKNVFVRKLDAVETLGAVEIIGLDKTGTLTEDRMAAVALHADNVMLAAEVGRLTHGGNDAERKTYGVVRRLLEAAALCSDATVRRAPEGFRIDGTPTESALIETALALGIDIIQLRLSAPVLATAARGDGRKRMSTLHRSTGGGQLLCVKGDPVEVLARCKNVLTASGAVSLDAETRADILTANENMAGQALRVLGVAVGETGGDPRDERNLLWLGLTGLANPIRPSVLPALKQLHRAGIRTVMITGDQSATAFAIARNLDLNGASDLKVLEAGQIAGLEPEVLAALAAQPQVFARVSPVDKLNIVKALQTNGRIVAMTGDGINDGPALRAADVGIAMGDAGSDIAREVADIVLGGDDLAGILEAIRLGRGTYANMRKVLRYLVSTNASETLTMLAAALVVGCTPLTPRQLLWLNLVSDPLPALALGLEPPEPDVLDKPPHDPRAAILTRGDFRRILREGTLMAAAALGGYILSGGSAGGSRASSVLFHGLTFAQLLHAITSRSETRGIVAELDRPSSPTVYGAIAASATLQVAAQTIPALRRLLDLAPLRGGDLLSIAAIALGSTLMNDAFAYVTHGDRAWPLPPKS
jgi:Ca2+-transporting ATPase